MALDSSIRITKSTSSLILFQTSYGPEKSDKNGHNLNGLKKGKFKIWGSHFGFYIQSQLQISNKVWPDWLWNLLIISKQLSPLMSKPLHLHFVLVDSWNVLACKSVLQVSASLRITQSELCGLSLKQKFWAIATSPIIWILKAPQPR